MNNHKQQYANGLAKSGDALACDPASARPRSKAKLLKRELSPVHRRALERLGMSCPDLAAYVDTQAQTARRWGAEDEPHMPRADHLAAGPAEWALDLLRVIVRQHGHDVQPAPAVVHGDDHGARLAAVTNECGDPARALATALADRVLTIAELELVVQEAREAVAAALELEAWGVAELARRRAER